MGADRVHLIARYQSERAGEEDRDGTVMVPVPLVVLDAVQSIREQVACRRIVGHSLSRQSWARRPRAFAGG